MAVKKGVWEDSNNASILFECKLLLLRATFVAAVTPIVNNCTITYGELASAPVRAKPEVKILAGFSGWARWKGPDAGKRCPLLALGVQVIGAMAELERSLIVERVRAGPRNAKAKGKRLGRPRVMADRLQITSLRAEGLSWAKIAANLGVGEGTVYRVAQASAKNPQFLPS
jgi:hypothetical protein